MEVTDIGYVLIVLSLIPSVRIWRILSVLFIPFTATAVINVNWGDGSSGLSAFHYFAVFYLFGSVCTSLMSGKRFALPSRLMFAGLLIIGALVASLFSAALIDGRYSVQSPLLADDLPAYAIRLSFNNFTQCGYVVVGLAFAAMLARDMRSRAVRAQVLGSFLVASVFACFWGWYQVAVYTAGLPYLEIFNSNAAATAAGFDSFFGDVKRMASVAVEPSIFAQTILVSAAIAPSTIRSVLRKPGKLALPLLMILYSTTILASTSASGIVGLAILLALRLYNRFRSIESKLSIVALLTPGTAIALPFALDYLGFGENKLESYSALERAMSVSNAFGTFLDFPIFGVGWGGVTSSDLIIRILANAGLFGLVAFGYLFLIQLHRRALSKPLPAELALFLSDGRIALITTLAVFLTTGFPYYFGFIWLIVAMCSLPMEQVEP